MDPNKNKVMQYTGLKENKAPVFLFLGCPSVFFSIGGICLYLTIINLATKKWIGALFFIPAYLFTYIGMRMFRKLLEPRCLHCRQVIYSWAGGYGTGQWCSEMCKESFLEEYFSLEQLSKARHLRRAKIAPESKDVTSRINKGIEFVMRKLS